MPKKQQTDIEDLLEFLNTSPTAWNAVDSLKARLDQHGFEQLKESHPLKLVPGHHYYITRNDSSLCAFSVPKEAPKKILIAASHTDSPALKLKPNAEFRKENMVMLGVEVYGGPLLSSWLNRDLGIAGQISYLDKAGIQHTSSVILDEHPVMIPQLAIHLDRQVNENGLILNKQEHLSALATLDSSLQDNQSFLERCLKEKIPLHTLLSHDLFLYPLQKASLFGLNNELLSSYRVDSLCSVHAILTGFLRSAKIKNKNTLKLALFYDNEEIGSSTSHGADSPFLIQIVEKIALALKVPREEYLCLFDHSFFASVDLAHSLHPNHADKHDCYHKILLEKGVVLKFNAGQRYATNNQTAAVIAEICHKHKMPFQQFVSRNDMTCGTTIGPIQASLTGIPTIDLGCSQLSMHSAREITSIKDHLQLCDLMSELFIAGHPL